MKTQHARHSETIHTRGPRRFAAPPALALVACAALLVASSAPLTASPQRNRFRSQSPQQSTTPKPKIADEDERDDKKNNNGSKPAETPKRGGGQQRRGGSGGGTPARPAPPPVEVTFTTDVPDAEIFLNTPGRQQSLGRTDADGKLTTRLARGTHQIIASRIGYRILRQQIDVRPDNVSFTINLSLPTPAPRPETAAAAEPAPTPEPADTVPASEKFLTDATELMRRYLDPRETSGVTGADWSALLTQAEAARAKEPDNAQLSALALLAEGQVAYSRQDFASALIAFNKAVREQPDLVAAHYGRGNAYLATNQPVEALKAYQRASELNPTFALAYKGQGDALTKQGKTREAGQFYSRAQSLGGSSSPSAAGGGAPSVLGYEAARNLKRQKRWAQALREFQQLAESKPTADLLIDIGDCYLGLEQKVSASQAYRRATELDPRAALAHYKFGEVMFDLREWAPAAEALERALALDLTGATVNRKRAREMANKAAEQVRKLSK